MDKGLSYYTEFHFKMEKIHFLKQISKNLRNDTYGDLKQHIWIQLNGNIFTKMTKTISEIKQNQIQTWKLTEKKFFHFKIHMLGFNQCCKCMSGLRSKI